MIDDMREKRSQLRSGLIFTLLKENLIEEKNHYSIALVVFTCGFHN